LDAKNILLIPAFIPFINVQCHTGIGKYCLYHGNLSVNENENAAIWLINNVFVKIDFALVIAGKNPSKKLIALVKKKSNISLVNSPTDKDLQLLIEHAHINVLPSLNQTGSKLKLVNALFNGRHCVTNAKALDRQELKPTYHIAETQNDWIIAIQRLMLEPFTIKDFTFRKKLLENLYNNKINAEHIIKQLY
jgi:hypothetical protein